MIQPAALNGSKYHVFISFPSERHRWAVRLHDMLTHFGIEVIMHQFPHPLLEPGVNLGLDRAGAQDAFSSSLARVLIWPTGVEELTPEKVNALADEFTHARFNCAVVIGKASIPDSLADSIVRVDEVTPEGWDGEVPSCEDSIWLWHTYLDQYIPYLTVKGGRIRLVAVCVIMFIFSCALARVMRGRWGFWTCVLSVLLLIFLIYLSAFFFRWESNQPWSYLDPRVFLYQWWATPPF